MESLSSDSPRRRCDVEDADVYLGQFGTVSSRKNCYFSDYEHTVTVIKFCSSKRPSVATNECRLATLCGPNAVSITMRCKNEFFVLRSCLRKSVLQHQVFISQFFGLDSLPVKAPLAVDFGEKTSQLFQGFQGNTGTHKHGDTHQMLGCWTPYDSHGFSAVWRIHVEVKKVDTKVEKDMDDGEPAPMSNGSKLQLFKNLLQKHTCGKAVIFCIKSCQVILEMSKHFWCEGSLVVHSHCTLAVSWQIERLQKKQKKICFSCRSTAPVHLWFCVGS